MLRLFASLAISFSAQARQTPSLDPSLAQFMSTCRENHRVKPVPRFELPKNWEDDTIFAPTSVLVGNQGRFSWLETGKKLVKSLQDDGGAYVDEKSGEWVRSNDEGRSLFPRKKAIRGIFYNGRIFIVDGHHRSLISTYFASETIPVRVMRKLPSTWSMAQVRKYMADNQFSFFRDHLGRTTPIVSLCDMVDDPNLGLARLLLARIEISLKDGRLQYGNVKGADYVIAAKIQNDLPFLEFEMADALRRGGVAWSNSNSTNLSERQLANFLEILEEDLDHNPESRLSQVLLFEEPTRVADIDLEPALTEHLIDIGCEHLLKKGKK